MTTDDYTKIDVVAVNKDLHNLTEWLKSSVTDKNREEYYRYVNKMYISIDKKNKSVTVSFPSYDEKQLDTYIEGVISSAIAIGFETYVREVNNVK